MPTFVPATGLPPRRRVPAGVPGAAQRGRTAAASRSRRRFALLVPRAWGHERAARCRRLEYQPDRVPRRLCCGAASDLRPVLAVAGRAGGLPAVPVPPWLRAC